MMIKKSRAIALLLFCSFIILQSVSAQKVFFRHYTVSDGLSANTIWDIEQDEQGYMWFGTKYGLSRFDGYDFKSFQYQKDIPGSLGNNFIRKIFNFDRKTFWIGTDEGIYIFNLETEKFTLFKPLQQSFINDIIRDRNGDIWIATKAEGVFVYSPKRNKIKRFNTTSVPAIASNEVSKILQDDAGEIWIGTYDKGIDVLNPKTNQIRQYNTSSPKAKLSSNVILDLYKDANGDIWIGTMAGGLNLWNKRNNRITIYRKSSGNSISDNIVRAIYEPKPGYICLGTEKGLNIFDRKNNRFTVYQKNNHDQYSINDDAVYKVFKDREGGIWVGTYFGGLNYFHEGSSGFEYYYPSGAKNSLSGNAVSAFLETGAGQVWIGTEDGGLNYFNASDKSFRKFPFSATQDSLSYHNIHALYEDKKGNIWVGMYTGGINILNPRTGKIKRYKSDPTNPASLSDNSVYSIDEDREGRIWVSTISGLNLYDQQNDRFIRIKGNNLEKSCIYQVYQDRDKVIWIATYDNGLIRMDQNNHFTQYAYTQKPGSISSNKVICMFDDDEGNLWIGTDGSGLNVLHKKTGKFKVLDDENWGNTVIYGILKDQSGKLWFSTNSGLFEYEPRTRTKRSFGKWDNVQSQQYNYKAYYKDSSGKLYFGGINGFNTFQPDEVKSSAALPKVSFTNFQLFNKDLKVNGPNSPLKQSINYTREIILNHNQSVLSVEYASLSFMAPNKLQYAFKMDGFDKGWNNVGSQRKATYTNLPPGEYSFQVKVIDDLGTGIGEVSSIKITILPPFYKTITAYLFYLIVLVVGAIWLRRLVYKKALKRNEIKLEQLKNKNEQDFYKQKIEFFTAMAHEVRTPLSLIIAPLEQLLAAKDKDPAHMNQLLIMEENSDRLLTLVNQLLDFRRIESDFFEIHPETLDLIYLVNSIRDRFSPIATKKGLEFVVVSAFKKLDIHADPEALMKILSNLLINAFKFARKRLEIKINELHITANGEEMISISVEDDGIGIPKAQLDSIFEKFFKVSTEEHQYTNLGGTGIGLALAKSLSEKHGGKLEVQSEEGLTTIFTVLIPFRQLKIAPTIALVEVDEEHESKLTVLVVEDDPPLLDFLATSFMAEGYHTLKAKNGKEGLKQLDKHQVDLVISDVMMPVMDGIELCKIIKQDIDYSHLPVVLLTAKTNTEAEIQGLESGADAYISKPFKWKQLSLIIKNLLELQSNLKQRFAQNPLAGPEILNTGNREDKFLEKITQIIEARISDPQLSVEDLGREVGLSRSSLYKKIKTKTGHVPNEFVRLIRLKMAAKLLIEQEYSIAEIGYMVGVNSHSYFSKCFYTQFELTPTEFVEKHRNVIAEGD